MVVFALCAIAVLIIMGIIIRLAISMSDHGIKAALSRNVAPIVMACVLLSAIVGYVIIGSIYIGQKARDHLEGKGYGEEEVQSIKITHSYWNIILSYDEWGIRVVFADEPTTIYRYDFRDGEVSQSGVSGSGRKHLEGTWHIGMFDIASMDFDQVLPV